MPETLGVERSPQLAALLGEIVRTRQSYGILDASSPDRWVELERGLERDKKTHQIALVWRGTQVSRRPFAAIPTTDPIRTCHLRWPKE